MAGPVFFRVNEAAVQSYRDLEVTHLVNHYIRTAQSKAKEFAPVRTGRLRTNIRWAGAKPTHQYGISGYIYANIGYAWFVEKGTTGPIRSASGKPMSFMANEGAGPLITRDEVAGQSGQHFMKRGLDVAMRTPPP